MTTWGNSEKARDDTLAPTLVQELPLTEDGEADAHWEKTPREPIFEIITSTAPKHLVILGDPGAGKSCLARYVALSLLEGLGRRQDQAANSPRPWIATLAGRLPFVLELRRFLIWEAKDGEGGFIGYLHHLGSDHGFGLNKADLDRHLRSAPSLVSFDGLDEVIDPRKRDDIAEAIVGFARTYSAARVIVTSRIAGFDQRPFVKRTSAFVVVTLDDLDLQQIETFSNTWFGLTLRADREQAETRHKHLVQSVRERPQLRTLAGNPLLLTVIALIARRQELPAARASLYEHALQIFCHQWDFEDKKLELPTDSPLNDLDLDDKLTVLRRIAWSMLQGEGLRANIIEKAELEKVIRSYFEAEWWPNDRAMCRRGAGEMIRVLEQRNYVICQQGAELFGFIHRTFLEYLCAAQILWRIEKDRDLSVADMCQLYVVPHCEDDSWREVIGLLAAQLQPRDAITLVGALLRHPIKRWGQRLRDEAAPSLTLAIGCLGERRRRDQRHFEALKQTVVEYSREDRDPAVRGAANWALGRNFPSDPAIRVLLMERAAKDPHPEARHAATSALGQQLTSDPELRLLLLEAASNKEDAHMRAAAMDSLGEYTAADSEIRSVLLEGTKDDDGEVRRAAIWPLAEHLASDREIRSLLFDQATKSDDATVRHAAVWALREKAASDADVRLLLIERSVTDSAPEVRQVAIWALGRRAASETEVRSLLIELATNDHDSDVRAAAMDALGEHAASDPEIQLLLMDWAKDDDVGVREAAVAALGEHGPVDTRIRSLLVERLKDDEPDVRAAAIWGLGNYTVSGPEIRWLLFEVAKDDDADVRHAVSWMLRRSAESDPEIRLLLMEQAGHTDPRVRQLAISALEWRGAGDHEIRSLLIERSKDHDAEVRRAAMLLLWQHAATDRMIWSLLLEGTKDDDARVRQAAISVLGEHAASDPEGWTLLLESMKDGDARVRQAAISAIGEHAASDPEIRSLLIERATNDNDESVRRTAVEVWFKEFGDRTSAVLLSRDFDAYTPALDPRQSIASERIVAAARRLRVDEEHVRCSYERLAIELPLILEWKNPLLTPNQS